MVQCVQRIVKSRHEGIFQAEGIALIRMLPLEGACAGNSEFRVARGEQNVDHEEEKVKTEAAGVWDLPA